MRHRSVEYVAEVYRDAVEHGRPLEFGLHEPRRARWTDTGETWMACAFCLQQRPCAWTVAVRQAQERHGH